MFEPRTYRKFVTASGLETFEVKIEDTDLQIAAERDFSGVALSAIHRIRGIIEHFIEDHPDFATTLSPFSEINIEWPYEIQAMLQAGAAADTGPMSAISGCICEYVGKAILREGEQVIVESDEDIFVHTKIERTLAIYAGESPLSMQLGLRLTPEMTPLGICTSSGTTGSSLSLGMTDAAIVISKHTALGDAVATALGNRVAKAEEVDSALDWAAGIEDILGAIVIIGEKIGTRGEVVDLVEL